MSTRLYSKRENLGKKSRGERIRPKTFLTEDKAKVYAKEKSIEKFTIEPQGKKFVIVQ